MIDVKNIYIRLTGIYSQQEMKSQMCFILLWGRIQSVNQNVPFLCWEFCLLSPAPLIHTLPCWCTRRPTSMTTRVLLARALGISQWEIRMQEEQRIWVLFPDPSPRTPQLPLGPDITVSGTSAAIASLTWLFFDASSPASSENQVQISHYPSSVTLTLHKPL